MDFKKIPGQKLIKREPLLNKSAPIISIVTPYYNAQDTIEETFNSVMNQTYPFFEWIIVDDGSKTEGANEKLQEIAKRDPRIKTYRKKNEGPSMTRDFAIEKTSKNTEYVFFLDANDLLDPTTLECLYWTLETHPEASFAYTTLVNFGEREFLWEKYLTIEQEKNENLINIASMVRKKDLLEVGCFGIKEKAMFEDWNLWLKLIRAGKTPLRVNAPLFWYRKDGESELSRANKNKENAMRYVTETASTIPNDIVEPIQFPRYGKKYATTKSYDLVLPDYKQDKRKTLLFIFPWMVVGGADFFNLELIKRLPNDKYKFIILTTTPNANPLRQSFEDYAEVYDMSSFLDRIDYQVFTDYIISSRKVDLVFISNSEYGYYMVPYLKNKYPNIPFIDYIHSVDNADPRKGFGRCTRDVDKYLYGTYCCNGYTKKELESKFDKKNVKTVYIGTDDDKFNPSKYNKEKLKDKYNIPKDKIVISFIARLSEEKRPTMFVEIAKRIHSRNSNTFFIIAGDGLLMPQVKECVDDNFKLLGMINETEEIYAISDITINCSSLEGLALTSYESLSMSTPVISTDVGGQTELIDDSVGGIVHYNKNASLELYDKEIDEYVEKTLIVIKNLSKLKKNCREKIQKGFSLKLMTKHIQEIIEEAINKNKFEGSKIIDTTTYELACESFYTLYFNYTNDYYERNLNLYLNAPTSNHPKLYRYLRNKLSAYNAVDEGKVILEFIRNFIIAIKKNIDVIIRFFKALIAGFIILFKVAKKIITKPLKK